MLQTPKVYQAIVNVIEALSKEGIAKSRKNSQQGYAFRGIDDIYSSLSSLLAKNNLCMLPRVMENSQSERASKSGGVLIYSIVKVEFDLVSSEDGSKHTIATIGEAMDSGDKGSNKAQSTAYKYAAIMAFCIPIEGDNDTENHTHEVAVSALEEDAKILANLIDLAKTPAELDDIIHSHANIIQELAGKQPTWHRAMTTKIDARKLAVRRSA